MFDIWTASSENVPSSLRKMRRFKSPCAFAKYRPGFCFPVIHSVVFDHSVSRQQRLRSDCADAQSDLSLNCPHMPIDTFSHDAVHYYNNIYSRIPVWILINIGDKLVFPARCCIHESDWYQTKVYDGNHAVSGCWLSCQWCRPWPSSRGRLNERYGSIQRAHDVYAMSHQRRCNVMTLHRRWYDVVSTLRVGWADNTVFTTNIWTVTLKTCLRTCAPTEDLDQLVHSRSLIEPSLGAFWLA